MVCKNKRIPPWKEEPSHPPIWSGKEVQEAYGGKKKKEKEGKAEKSKQKTTKPKAIPL